MPNVTTLIYEEGVFEDALFTGVFTDVIDHLDLSAKRIHLRTGVREYHPVDDIYREIRYIRANDESLRVMDMPVEATGNIPKGGGKFTPRLAIFKYGWRVVPANETHVLKILGEQITDDGRSGADVMDMTLSSPGVNVSIEYAPPDSEIVRVSVGDNVYSLAQIEQAVWSATNRTLTSAPVTNAPTPEQNAAAVWNAIIESGLSAAELMRLMTAFVSGDAENLASGNPVFKSIDGSKVRIAGTYENGFRTISVRNGS